MFEFLVGQEEQTYFRRSELKELFNQHGGPQAQESDGAQSTNNFPLSEVEMRIIRGILFRFLLNSAMQIFLIDHTHISRCP